MCKGVLFILPVFNGDEVSQGSGEETDQPDQQPVAPAGNNEQSVFFQSSQGILNNSFGGHPQAFGYPGPVHFDDVVKFRICESGAERLNADGRADVFEIYVKTFGETVDPGLCCAVSVAV